MKWYIRKWLGLLDLDRRTTQLESELTELQSDFAAAAYDEHDQRRIDASNKLGQREIVRLEAEQKVRDHYGYSKS